MVLQRALEALVSDWMGVLSGLRRLWEADEVTRLISTPGEANPPHTPLPALIDAGDFRSLVAQLQQSWQNAFAEVEDFRLVIAPATCAQDVLATSLQQATTCHTVSDEHLWQTIH